VKKLFFFAILMALATWHIAHTPFQADMGVFMPRLPTAKQQLLVEQLRDGVASRLLLLGITGAPAESLQQASSALSKALNAHPAFRYASNGTQADTAQETATS
jgi:predicted exporter